MSDRTEIRFYQSECGDAARVRFFGNDGKYHNILIDSGYERTFRYVLADEIREIETAAETIDLWIISHIHDDHIGGVVSYVKSIEDGEINDIAESWYYNLPRKQELPIKSETSRISEPKSISQGDVIAKYISNKGVPIYETTNEDDPKDFYGLRITVLSPNKATLEKLRIKYSDEATELEREEMDAVSFAKAAVQHDYHIPVDKFDLQKWVEDNSIENRSSIALITEHQNRRVIWLADAHPSIVTDKLRKIGYSKLNPICCDWVKVTHHGSKGNNSSELFEMISCENYLISANGENIHCLPTKECISRILRNENRSPASHYKLFFTSENELIRSMFEIDGKEVFRKFNFSIHFPPAGSKMIRAFLE